MLKQVQHDNDLFAKLEIPKQSWIIGSSEWRKSVFLMDIVS